MSKLRKDVGIHYSGQDLEYISGGSVGVQWLETFVTPSRRRGDVESTSKRHWQKSLDLVFSPIIVLVIAVRTFVKMAR